MKRLVEGMQIHLADGRRMTVQRVETVDGVRVVWWSEQTPEQLADELERRLAAFRVAKYGAQALRDRYQPPDQPWYANSGQLSAQTRIA